MLETTSILQNIENSTTYSVILFYIGIYPLFGGILWIVSSIIYWFHRERKAPLTSPTYQPKISVIIPAFNEEKYIRRALDSVCALNYPDYEVVVINDGSTDNTANILKEYVTAGKIRVITKRQKQGKAMAINDALMCLNGEIFFIMDADSEADPEVLNYMIPHFERARVAIVAGNPRAKNVDTLLARMQLIEYSAIIGMIRRSQRLWGRSMAISGAVFAVRKIALFDVGGFTPAAATEDMDLAWKVQRKFWDIVFEARAIVWSVVPTKYKGFFKQRIRWARGLMNVLHEYYDVMLQWKHRRMWPVFVENILSTFWSVCFVICSIFWAVSFFFHISSPGEDPIPQIFGMLIASVSLILCSVAILLDKKYDPQLSKYYFYIIFFPFYYWVLLTIVAVIAMPALFKKSKTALHWHSER